MSIFESKNLYIEPLKKIHYYTQMNLQPYVSLFSLLYLMTLITCNYMGQMFCLVFQFKFKKTFYIYSHSLVWGEQILMLKLISIGTQRQSKSGATGIHSCCHDTYGEGRCGMVSKSLCAIEKCENRFKILSIDKPSQTMQTIYWDLVTSLPRRRGKKMIGWFTHDAFLSRQW